jgi:hypothetical protein
MMQRWAAKELVVSPSSVKAPSSREDKVDPFLPWKKLPVLEHSTFVLEEFNANEWITVLRCDQKKMVRAKPWRSLARPRPRRKLVSNFFEKGVVQGHKAYTNSCQGYCSNLRRRSSPVLIADHGSPTSGDSGSRYFQNCRPAGQKAQKMLPLLRKSMVMRAHMLLLVSDISLN